MCITFSLSVCGGISLLAEPTSTIDSFSYTENTKAGKCYFAGKLFRSKKFTAASAIYWLMHARARWGVTFCAPQCERNCINSMDMTNRRTKGFGPSRRAPVGRLHSAAGNWQPRSGPIGRFRLATNNKQLAFVITQASQGKHAFRIHADVHEPSRHYNIPDVSVKSVSPVKQLAMDSPQL